ncbi:hypothetical protein GP486_006777 [Trichoglossum hirsutum]|uniref:Uncharacterized protein n=1 Tax=Trichoglossum hirsutum TaxID=265104 RepID=A0A9P8ICZ0_9PEZI|nr:hypothetical protein GP486_006777 [Trichoglossum hirsutum]
MLKISLCNETDYLGNKTHKKQGNPGLLHGQFYEYATEIRGEKALDADADAFYVDGGYSYWQQNSLEWPFRAMDLPEASHRRILNSKNIHPNTPYPVDPE